MSEPEDSPLLPTTTQSTPSTSQHLLPPLFSNKNESSARRSMSFIQDVRRRSDVSEDKKMGLDAVLESLQESQASKNRNLILSLIGIIVHVFGGALLLCFLEGWSYVDAIYFCIVTVTTVGYGDITPDTTAAKLFVMFYVIVSIFLISSLLATFVGALLDQQEELALRALLRGDDQTSNQVQSTNNILRTNTRRSRLPKFLRKLLAGLEISDFCALGVSASYLLLIIIAGVLTFTFIEGLSFIDALYATIISATTVGFGDFEPTKDISKILMTIWLTFSTIGLVKVIADFTDASVKAKQRTITKRLVTARFDVDSWENLDKDKDGYVDKAEFVTELLIRTGKVERKQVDAFLKRFEELDHDNSGSLCINEIQSQLI